MFGRFGPIVRTACGVAIIAATAIGARVEADPEEHGEEHREFSPAEYEAFGVRFATAAPGTVDFRLELPGEVRPNADRLAHMSPRFPGLVREVRKRAGDSVRAGEILAIVESDTLAPFEMRASFDGTVLDRHITPGEIATRDRPAFIIADLSTVWVEVSVHQAALPEVKSGQPVHVSGGPGLESEATVSYISPVVDQATRAALARVVLPNSSGEWRPGLFVTVSIVRPIEAALVVPRRAVHRFEDREVVFVVEGDHVEPRPVRLGRTGFSLVEIVSGLAPGERYADEGSFLVKAELAKGEVGHDH